MKKIKTKLTAEKKKNIILYSLVITSLSVTSYLFWESPAYNYEQEHLRYPAKEVSKSLYELTTPSLMVIHNAGESSLLLPKSQSIHYKLLEIITNTKVSNPHHLQLSTDLRQRLFNKSKSVELQYINGCPLPILATAMDSFSLNNPSININIKIDSIWLVAEPRQHNVYLLLISSARKKAIQFETDITTTQIKNLIKTLKNEDIIQVKQHFIENNHPSDNNFLPLYFPKYELQVDQLLYSWQKVELSQLITNLFAEQALEPLKFSDNNEEDLFYTFNEHSLYSNYRKQTITYRNNSESIENNESIQDTAMEIINHFINQHYGWMQNKYTLERVSGQKNDELYTFRLIKEGLLVYRDDNMDGNSMLDTLQIGLYNNNITKYRRPSQILTPEPENTLGKKTIWPLTLQNITLKQLQKTPLKACFLAYLAIDSDDDSQILLKPVWVMITADNKPIMEQL